MTRAIGTKTAASGAEIVTGIGTRVRLRFVEGLDLPRGLEREIVLDERDRTYELNGEDCCTRWPHRVLETFGDGEGLKTVING